MQVGFGQSAEVLVVDTLLFIESITLDGGAIALIATLLTVVVIVINR